MIRGANVSDCGQYRYRLFRIWDVARPVLVFVMLNPSTADASEDDPTVRKCIGFAQRGRFGGIVIVNLYAFRATQPADMRRAADAIGRENDRILVEELRGHTVVLAWGANARHDERAKLVTAWAWCFAERVCVIRTLDDGTPAHPLMLPYAIGINDAPPFPGERGAWAVPWPIESGTA